MIILPESSFRNLFALWILSQIIPHRGLELEEMVGVLCFILFLLYSLST